MKKPLLSVCLITYNHENFIRQAIEGVLMQKVDFEWELIIADDYSTDKTRDIILEYKQQYPDFIKLIFQEKNIGPAKNWLALMSKPKSKYIAYFEGDDYWTDPLKLKKQVDFLESNSKYGICFHNVMELNTFDASKNRIIPNILEDLDYTLEEYVITNRTASCSIVFKSEYASYFPKWFIKAPFGDLGLILLVMFNSNEKGRVLKDNMGVYRIHANGVHGSFQQNNKSLIKAYLQHVQFNKMISKELLSDKKYRKIISEKMLITYNILRNLYSAEKQSVKVLKASLWIKYYKLINKSFS